MAGQADATATRDEVVRVVDCAVHPLVRHSDELREYMPEPWRSRPFPPPERYFYPALDGEYWKEACGPMGLPGSDPDLLARQLFSEAGVDCAVLLPLTRGLLPNTDLATAICAATNDWLADTWLSKYNAHGRFRGTIRVNPGDPEAAVREIERWAGHRYMVQVAVPMEAHHPYGQRMYLRIWEAAARHGLPVAVHADGGCGVDFWPTQVGYPRHHIEYSSLYPLTYGFHLGSLIVEGVFERLPGLKFVFADGGHDFLAPLIWRFDKNWRPTRYENPWISKMPSAYLREHVRFCSRRLEGPKDSAALAEWLEICDAAELLLFASRYPHWDFHDPRQAFADIPEALRVRILAKNARELYGL